MIAMMYWHGLPSLPSAPRVHELGDAVEDEHLVAQRDASAT